MLDKIIQNYGLSHIGIKIFEELDYKSLCQARLVSHAWKELIDNEMQDTLILKRKTWMVNRDESIELKSFLQSKDWFLKTWPEWKSITRDFVQNRATKDVKKLLEVLNYYFDYYPHISNLYDPLMVAIGIKNDLTQVKLIVPSVKNLNFQNKNGRTILHKAVTYGRLEIVDWLLETQHHKIDFKIEDKYERTVMEEAIIQYSHKSDQSNRQAIYDKLRAFETENTSWFDNEIKHNNELYETRKMES